MTSQEERHWSWIPSRTFSILMGRKMPLKLLQPWFFPILFIIIAQQTWAEGIRCYECSSAWNDDCHISPPPSRYLKLCPSVPICSKFYAEENGIVRVERYCGGSDFSNGCRDASFPDGAQGLPGTRYRAVSCRCNDRDGCNGGMKMGLSLALLIIAFSILIL